MCKQERTHKGWYDFINSFLLIHMVKLFGLQCSELRGLWLVKDVKDEYRFGASGAVIWFSNMETL